jgi:hypothetical protein
MVWLQVEEDMKDAAQKDLKELVGGGRKKNKEKSKFDHISHFIKHAPPQHAT